VKGGEVWVGAGRGGGRGRVALRGGEGAGGVAGAAGGVCLRPRLEVQEKMINLPDALPGGFSFGVGITGVGRGFGTLAPHICTEIVCANHKGTGRRLRLARGSSVDPEVRKVNCDVR